MKYSKVNWAVTLVIFGKTATAATVVAPLLESNWLSRGSKTECVLQHSIGSFGVAGFKHEAGTALQFFLQAAENDEPTEKASLFVEPAPWQQSITYRRDYAVYWHQLTWEKGYLAAYGATAELMLSELAQGHYPVFSFVKHRIETRVAVASVNFTQPYQQFLLCRHNLLPFNVTQLAGESLYFDQASAHLSASMINRLNAVVSYAQEMSKAKVSIVNDTFDAANRGGSWFGKRAQKIAQYLVSLGLPQQRIQINNKAPAGDRTDNIQLKVFGPDDLRFYYFDKGSTRLTAAEQTRLREIARYTNEHFKQGQILVASHTDSKGSASSNKAFSQSRGNMVKEFLRDQGVDEQRIIVKAYGESQPVKSNRFPQGRAQNRRIVISFIR